MPAPEVRVGIVSWNTAALLERCLLALPAALGDLRAEVVVVDNASDDESATTARRHGVDVVVNETNRGYAVAMNQALAGSAAPVLIALNPDTEPPTGSLAHLVTDLRTRPDAGVVVPRLVGGDGAPQHSAYRWPTPLPSLLAALSTSWLRTGPIGRKFLLEGSGPHRTGPVPWAIGAVHVIRAGALEGEPPYAERSFMYAEDLDLCWRLGDRGWSTWLDAEVAVPHVGNAAGAQAWGEGRSTRFWAATYDVVALRRSPRAARVLGVGALVASMVAVLRNLPGALVGGMRPGHRGTVRRLLGEARLHARVAVSGPPPPPIEPPAAGQP
jgi:GT2 family glycosyltransferase